MKFEPLLEEVGTFGKFQKLLCFILIPITTGLIALNYYTQIFILTAPHHFCHQQLQQQCIKQKTNPIEKIVLTDIYGENLILNDNKNTKKDFGKNVPNDAFKTNDHVYALDVSYRMELFLQNALKNQETIPPIAVCNQPTETICEKNLTAEDEVDYKLTESLLKNDSTSCSNGWYYDQQRLFSTLASEKDWVCNEAWKPYFITSFFWLGNIIGAWVLGVLGDIYGRRPTILLSMSIYGVMGVASVFVQNFYGFLCLRFLMGTAHHTISHLPFVLVVEYCGIKSRVVPLFTIMMTYTTASILAPLLAWVIWNWKILALVSSVPALGTLLFYRFLPESSSWLLSKNKISEAEKQMITVARINGCKDAEDLIPKLMSKTNNDGELYDLQDDPDSTKDTTKTSVFSIIKYPKLRVNILIVLFVWMVGCMCFYGHCQNTANLGNSIIISYILGALVEIPSWSTSWFINKYGRRPVLVTCFLISGVSGVVYFFIPQNINWLVITIALVGRLTITAAYYITLQYCPELFPTIVRGQGVAVAETLGGAAIFTSPLIVYLGEKMITLPLLVFGVLSLLGGVVTLFLPETLGVALPANMEEGEQFASQSVSAIKNCCASTRSQKK